MFDLVCHVIGVRHVKSKKDGQEYTLVEFGIAETFEKFSCFIQDEKLLSKVRSFVGGQATVSFLIRGGYSVTLEIVDIT